VQLARTHRSTRGTESHALINREFGAGRRTTELIPKELPPIQLVTATSSLDRVVGTGFGEGIVWDAPGVSAEDAKSLLPGLESETDTLERSTRRTAMTRRIRRHDIFSAGEFGRIGKTHSTEEGVESETLAEVIRREGRLDWRRALRGARQIAYALDSAPAQGIIHRDLKPSNIIVSGKTMRMAGQGLSSVTPDQAKFTSDGILVGTPPYAAPEQWDGRELDVRSDVYSLGVILFELLSGKTPFEAPTPDALFQRTSTEKLPDLQKLVPELPPAAVDLVGRMLATRREERLATARQVADEVYHILRPQSAPRQRARWPIYFGIAAGLYLVAGAVSLRLVQVRTPMIPSVRSNLQLPVVAVAPFKNRAADDELNWLRPGLADLVATDLSAARGLRVLRKARPPRGGYVLSGAFVRAGERLRIDAQLTDPATGRILFARKVEGDAEQLFALVDSLCEKLLFSASKHLGAEALDASSLRLEGVLFEGPEEPRARSSGKAWPGLSPHAPKTLKDGGPARLRAVELYYRAEDLRRAGKDEEVRKLLEEARALRTGFKKLDEWGVGGMPPLGPRTTCGARGGAAPFS